MDSSSRAHRLTNEVVTTEDALRAILGEPTPIVLAKQATKLIPLTRPFVEKASFVLLATCDQEGHVDVSPRGDAAGFVRILDDETLLLPERPGNRIADSLRNVIANPRVGLLFIVPGVGETFRVNGRATITSDRALLEPSTAMGKVPKLGILVDIEEAYTHCSKAFIRSDFWNPEHHLAREALPSNGRILEALGGGKDFDADAYDQERAERYARRENFY
ncbi:MAG: pyridoxamine 5'-phosphate oxidase family protein [Deltaproteobacteria bacterium]|nr:pyridoxamine 5'-phosphate oxidase family protein [Deltaproteobacteria bacterium]